MGGARPRGQLVGLSFQAYYTPSRTFSQSYDWADSEMSDRRKFGELRNGAKHAAVPRGRQRSAALVMGHHGHSTAPSR